MMSFDTNAIRNAAGNIKNYSSEFQQKLEKIKQINEDIKNNWQGVAADSYLDAIAEQHAQMSKLTATIEGIGEFLTNLATSVEELERGNMVSGQN